MSNYVNNNSLLFKYIDTISVKLVEIWDKIDPKSLHISLKGSHRDIVTEYDLLIENKLKKILKGLIRSADFMGEETSNDFKDNIFWVVDPIDGTTNFSKGNKHFSTQVSLMKKDEVLFGIVYDPVRKELFRAVKGNGTYLNGKRIHVSKTSKLENASIHTGLQYMDQYGFNSLKNRIANSILNGRALRITGSACLDLAYIACGRTDIFFEQCLKTWDVSAGTLLIEEAGGKISTCNPVEEKEFNIRKPNILAYNGNENLVDEFRRKVMESD
ncbi:MAG: monophosphatase [Kosmotogales bacterium]|nr:monophosphatase [Kosmotogales bacterium]